MEPRSKWFGKDSCVAIRAQGVRARLGASRRGAGCGVRDRTVARRLDGRGGIEVGPLARGSAGCARRSADAWDRRRPRAGGRLDGPAASAMKDACGGEGPYGRYGRFGHGRRPRRRDVGRGRPQTLPSRSRAPPRRFPYASRHAWLPAPLEAAGWVRSETRWRGEDPGLRRLGRRGRMDRGQRSGPFVHPRRGPPGSCVCAPTSDAATPPSEQAGFAALRGRSRAAGQSVPPALGGVGPVCPPPTGSAGRHAGPNDRAERRISWPPRSPRRRLDGAPLRVGCDRHRVGSTWPWRTEALAHPVLGWLRSSSAREALVRPLGPPGSAPAAARAVPRRRGRGLSRSPGDAGLNSRASRRIDAEGSPCRRSVGVGKTP